MEIANGGGAEIHLGSAEEETTQKGMEAVGAGGAESLDEQASAVEVGEDSVCIGNAGEPTGE
jgi:hypothetical protein